MEKISSNSPASVATELIKDHIPITQNINLPPMHPHANHSCFGRSTSLPPLSTDDDEFDDIFLAAADGATTQDDIDAHRSHHQTMHGNLFISEATRRILEKMDDNQVKNARQAFAAVKQQRRVSHRLLGGSGINIKETLGEIGRRSSKRISWQDDDDGCDVSLIVSLDDAEKRRSDISRGSVGKDDSRLFSQSMGPLGKDMDLDDMSYGSDESDDKEAMIQAMDEDKGSERRFCKSMGAMANFACDDDYDEDNTSEEGETQFQPMSLTLGQLKEVEDIADETLERIVNRNDATFNITRGGDYVIDSCDISPEVKSSLFPMPTSTRRQSQRRNGLKTRSSSARQVHTSTWKPLSSNKQEDDRDKKKEIEDTTADKQGGGGIGNFWNKITSSFTEQSNNRQAQAQLSPKKEINGATYFRRGKKKANKCQFLQAVALYNFALVRQREELGENHIDCGTTLNEIGVCWMMLGERYPALTAFEEALYIRQEGLGVGAMEVAETTNNIWMILHEERCEMENLMEEGEEEDG